MLRKNRKLRIKVGEQSAIEISCRGTICNQIFAKKGFNGDVQRSNVSD